MFTYVHMIIIKRRLSFGGPLTVHYVHIMYIIATKCYSSDNARRLFCRVKSNPYLPYGELCHLNTSTNLQHNASHAHSALLSRKGYTYEGR